MVTDLSDFNAFAQTTNLGVRGSNPFGRAKYRRQPSIAAETTLGQRVASRQ